MRNYKTILNDIIKIIEQHINRSLIGFDDIAADMSDWERTTKIDHIPVYQLKRGRVDENHIPSSINIDFGADITIRQQSLIQQLLDACPVRIRIKYVSCFYKVNFNDIPAQRIVFQLYGGKVSFVDCDCSTNKASDMFYIGSPDNITGFVRSKVSPAFLTSLRTMSFFFNYCDGLHDLDGLSACSHLVFVGCKDNHFPLSFRHAPIHLLTLRITYERSEATGPASLTCLKEMYRHIHMVDAIRIELQVDLDIPLLNFVIIGCDSIKILTPGNQKLRTCVDIIENAIYGVDDYTNVHDRLLAIQEQLIEIGGGRYAKL